MAQEILNAHNSYRSQVGVPPLTWSDDLARQAQEWAKYLSDTGKFEHSGANGQGENIWMGTSRHYSFTQMIQSFGNESRRILFVEHSLMLAILAIGLMSVTILKWFGEILHKSGCAGVDGRDGKYRTRLLAAALQEMLWVNQFSNGIYLH
jgi:hypothetical protein